jgi:hypothetical protein
MLTMWSSQDHPGRRPRTRKARRDTARRRRGLRPRPEGLEDRTVLSTLTVLNNLDLAIGGAGYSGGAFAGAGFGGAITNILGVSLTLSNSTISDNRAVGGRGGYGGDGSDAPVGIRGGYGGDGSDAPGVGLANLLGASLTVSDSTLVHNQARGGVSPKGGSGSGVAT